MRLWPLFSAASLAIGASPAPAQTDTMSPEVEFVSRAMASYGDTTIVMMDKKEATLTLIENGHIVWKFRALYGKGRGDDIRVDPTTTPAGIFNMVEYTIDPKEYEGGKGYAFQCTSKLCYMIHPTWQGDPSEERNQRLATATPTDNAISRGGCINISEEDYLKFETSMKARLTIPVVNGYRVPTYPKLIVLPEQRDISSISQILKLQTRLEISPAP